MAVRLNHRNHAAEGNFRRILVGLSTRNRRMRKVKKEDSRMMEKIMDSGMMGYGYLYPIDGGNRQETLISTTPENLANYIGSHMYDAEKIVVTDICDRLILDTFGCFINTCPDQKLCQNIIKHLAPIQMGEKEADKVLEIDRDTADEYFAAEDQAVTMAELGM